MFCRIEGAVICIAPLNCLSQYFHHHMCNDWRLIGIKCMRNMSACQARSYNATRITGICTFRQTDDPLTSRKKPTLTNNILFGNLNLNASPRCALDRS
ncbi:hypothetical protein BGS_0731 [Beggiatoa sp. SS]|nr:hypothetical protein BGS_0731 [Beggiatoa sp. SS]